jgi:hypothetical protein
MVVVGVAALAAAPAATAQTEYRKDLGWYPEDAAAPSAVQLEDVAADGETVVAVGQDAATETAALYRRVGDSWQAEALPALPAPSKLTDVAVHGAEEWAIGSAGGQALVLHRLDGVWVPQVQLPNQLRSVAVRGAKALVGDDQGKIHVFDSSGVTVHEPFAAGAINDISLTGEGAGVAVAAFEEALPAPFPVFGANSVRIYSLRPDGSDPDYEAAARTSGVNMTAVAAASNGAAVARDDTIAGWDLI